MAKSVLELLREAAAALERQNQREVTAGVDNNPTTSSSTTPSAPEGRTARAEVLRLFSPYPPRGVPRRSIPPANTKKPKKTTYTHIFFCLAKRKDCNIPNPKMKKLLQQAGLGERRITFPDRSCSATEFSDHLQLSFPQLKHCGGFQLLRSRGSTRSRVLDVLPCSKDGYTPEFLCNKELGVGAAVIYIRPLQKDIVLENTPSATTSVQSTGPTVECVYCTDTFTHSEIEGHIDSCEKKHNSDLNAEETSESTASGSSGMSQPGTSDATSLSSHSQSEANYSSFEDWTTEPNIYKAANLFRQHLIHNAELKPELVARLDLRTTEEDREREILTFYKKQGIDWASPFSVVLGGDAAVGDGVKRHFLSMVIEKIQFGFDLNLENTGRTLLFNGADDHKVPSTSRALIDGDLFRVAGRAIGHSFIHGGPSFTGLSPAMQHLIVGSNEESAVFELSDCPDTDVVEVVSVEECEVNNLAFSWDLPPINKNNRRWLSEKILRHAVIERRQTQIKQIRKGLKDSGVFNMIKQRPALATVLFPRTAEQIMDSQTILKRIIWPMPDSEDEDDHGSMEEACLVTGFLRDYIENGSSQELHQLLKFWTGWSIPPQQLYVEVSSDICMPVASTCMTTLKLPQKCPSYQTFKENLAAAVRSTEFGFGMI
ncbi:uncharacterized protein LOC110014692 isoform X2 [Oryzias latipes]|uniref:uncharacterized protein LOC110014692 isoform X2 n=1 Tax=Oryzias latipes TaxID=8090 RepID=UPI000CE24844|nr:uncharacterized protein LOC110014692 isoform X2 [Oryzias latipes]